MKIKYRDFNFRPETLALILQANLILATYEARRIVVTLRQLFYQFVVRDIIPNRQSEYKRLGSIVNDARLAGLIDWDHLHDRTRSLNRLSHWDDPAGVIDSAAESYHRDLWEGQENYVEVWIEKDALIGVIEGICEDFDVPYFSCRGYTSQSEMWGAAQRLRERESQHLQDTHILHLGDHDPSGKDMTRDIQDRLKLFGARTEVHRIALNMDQIQRYNPPPNPAKASDSRVGAYIAEFGNESWELDALDPDVLIALIRQQIETRLDRNLLDEQKARQESEREVLVKASGKWDRVRRFLDRL